MLRLLFLLTCSLIGCAAIAQDNDTWRAFVDPETEFIGFTGPSGEIKVPPQFSMFTIAKQFKDIIAVSEPGNKEMSAYYLLKNGKKIGTDSLYIIDNSPDCENEGHIRFKLKEEDKVGLFNSKGQVVVSAVYDDLTMVHNGLLAALKGAAKKYYDPDDGHYSWTGGETMLLDTLGNVLIRDFNYTAELDLYTLKVQDAPDVEFGMQNFIGENGRFYVFENVKKQFERWLQEMLLSKLTVENVAVHSWDSLYQWSNETGWKAYNSFDFIKSHQQVLSVLESVKYEGTDYFITIDGLNPFIYSGMGFGGYFNTCGQPMIWKHPVLRLIINYEAQGKFEQDQFDFLKAEDGFRLISFSLHDE